jgi:O-antigen ligase
MLGRNATLTDRTEVWADTLALDDSPILGTGFESFWLGKRLDILWAKWWWHPNEAHNGYIETYLSLGAVGLLLLIVLIVSAFRRISARFGDDFDIARLHMGFLFAIVIYNFTEATFKGLALLYTLFLIIALNVPHWRPVSTDIVSAKEPG